MTDLKKKYVCTVDCPYCGESLDVVKETEIVVPAEPAEKRERFMANKNLQTKLACESDE